MRIGIEAFRVFRKQKHGMDIVALEMIRQLQLLDTTNQYFIFCFDDDDDVHLHETINFRIIRIPLMPSPVAEQFILPFLVQKYKINLLHSTSNTCPLFTGCRQIVTLHDIIFLEQDKKLVGGTLYQQIGNMYRRLIVPHAIRKAERVITVSESEQNKILEIYPQLANRLDVIKNSYCKHFSEKPVDAMLNIAMRYKLPRDGFIFVHGNTDPKKNFSTVMKALYLLKQKGKLTKKVVISDMATWRIMAIIKKHKLQGLEKDLLITNYITNTDLPDVYNLASVFLYPSLRESFGMPILESMACGTPVITSNRCAMPEVGGNAAKYINPENPDELASAISKILNNEFLREEMRQLGLLQIKKFSWKKSAELLLNLYQASTQPTFTSSSIPY